MYAFDQLCEKLKSDGDIKLYTLEQLHEIMCEPADYDDITTVYRKDYL